MRCPKCATAFVVEKPSVESDLPAQFASPAPQSQRRPGPKAASPITAPRPERKPTAGDRTAGDKIPGLASPGHALGPDTSDVGLPALGVRPPGAAAAKPSLGGPGAPTGEGRPKPSPPRRGAANPDDELLPQTANPICNAAPGQRPVTQGKGVGVPRPEPRPQRVVPETLPPSELEEPEESEEPALPSVLDSELPAALAPRDAASARKGAGKKLAALADDDLVDLPSAATAEHEGMRLPALLDDSARRRQPSVVESEPPLSLAPASTSVKTSSNPPELDDFEFDLPSPMQAQKGRSVPATARGLDDQRQGTIPGGFEFPDLDLDLPMRGQSTIGLPSVPGRDDGSKKTISGTGPVQLGVLSDLRPAVGTSPPREVDLGLDLELTSDRPRAPSASDLTNDGGSRKAAVSSVLPELDIPLSGSPSHPKTSMVDIMELSVPTPPLPQGGRSGASPQSMSSMRALTASQAGGTAYGEVSLDSSEHELTVETELGAAPRRSQSGESLAVDIEPGAARRGQSGEFAEFGGPSPVVDAANCAAAAAVNASAVRTAAEADTQVESQKTPRVRSRRTRLIVVAVVAFLAMGGSALTLLPDVGPFGASFLVDQIRHKDNEALVLRHVNEAHKVLMADDFAGVERVTAGLEAARRDHERLRTLKAFAAYYAYAIELRHGSQPQSRARAGVMLAELGNRTDLKYLGLAAAARAAVEGNLAKARHAIEQEIAREPRNVEAQVTSAEIALLDHRPADALATWQSVARLEPSARAAFGQARSQFALGQLEAATASAQQALQLNASHVGAKLLLARVALDKQGDIEQAQRLIDEALKLQAQQSVADFVLGKTLIGDLQLLRSRISLAEAAYREALAKEPHCAAALRGLGETLYRAGRYSESLARCEAGLQSDPDNVLVAVGVAKAELALERVQDAVTLLSRLRQSNPKHQAVNYWYGRAQEAAGNREEAEKAYAVAIEGGGKEPAVIDAYVGMALLKNQLGRREEAQKLLAVAQEKLPRVPKIHEALGQLALSEGRYTSAIEQFKLAQALDPSDIGIKFRLGVALRKNREFDAASKVFDEVTAVDRDYPGLALERGQLYEASGQNEEALRAFESALAKAPTDPDLMLRVGCGKVAAGKLQQAEQLLKHVLDQRPTSAETHHCLGRAQLLDGSNLALALRTLERAVELDPHRAEYHLYVGWAANEAGRVAVAEQALKKALELDQGLGDAYWQRGILRYRQGAVKDAVADLTRALELSPGRYEAHAALADAYFDLGLEQKALEQWRLATVAQPDNATWRYRYGKLLQAAHRDADARPELDAALALAGKLDAMPRWAWEAHHLLARAIGAHPSAVKHWQAFLELAPRDNVYRDEAKQALSKLGQPWDRD
jgi:tetratricopeptide (TPR) repeat protein